MTRETRGRRDLLMGSALLVAFAFWTALIQCVDVQPVGQNGTNIGLATFNSWFHGLTGVHLGIYTVTDWLGLVPIAVCLCFGVFGAVFSALMVFGRLVAGVHWATDIVGAILLAAGLFMLYRSAVAFADGKKALGKRLLSIGMILSVAAVTAFIASRQPYAGIICFALLVVKGFLVVFRK